MPASFAFTLVPDTAANVPTVSAPAAPVVIGQASTAKKSGLVWPFKIGANGNPVTGTGDVLRESRVGFVMSTRASSTRASGEIPMRMRLGSLAHLLLNTSFNDVREALAVLYGQRAMSAALPYELVMAAAVDSDTKGEVNVTLFVADRRTVDKGKLQRIPVKITRRV